MSAAESRPSPGARPASSARSGCPVRFLEAALYTDPRIAELERHTYATALWHPVAAAEALAEGQALGTALLEMPILLTKVNGVVHAFRNRCPHRGVPFDLPEREARSCRRLVCPYHGWTYDLQGTLRAAAREDDFLEPFQRQDWPLQPLVCRVLADLIWVAGGPDPLAIEDQLDLLVQEAGPRLNRRRQLLGTDRLVLGCNWKIAHDNTLDDYHVAIAHPTTLHREQGPVRHYRHALSSHASLLATPWGNSQDEFLTFGLAPWTHLLLWPDGRLAVIQFPPIDPGRCRMDLWLLGMEDHRPGLQAWLGDLKRFLEEDRRLVEQAQIGYATGLRPGPPHRLEQRILQHHDLYSRLMERSGAAGQSA
ncbi:MAG: aromatic ring-hydroxylating oxygenase subunit alpha [Cyanobium sp.]